MSTVFHPSALALNFPTAQWMIFVVEDDFDHDFAAGLALNVGIPMVFCGWPAGC